MKTFAVRWLVGLLIGAFVVSACYGSTRPVVKIGLIAPFEELYRDDGYEVLNAVKLAVNQRNAAGGIAGRDVALVALNDNGRPDEARRQAAKMAVDADVLGVIGPVKTGSAAAGQALTGHGVPWIALTELAPAELSGGFSLALSPETLGAAAVDALLAQPDIRSVVLLSDWPEAQAGAAATEAAVRSLPLASVDQVVATAGEGVAWLGEAENGARLASALGSQASMVGSSEAGSHMFAGRAGDAAATVAWLSAAPDVDQMPQDFVAQYLALTGADPGPQAILAYDATNLLLDAMALAGAGDGELDRKAVQRALLQLGNDGWQGSVDMIRWETGCQLAAGCQRMDEPIYQHAVR